MGNKGEEGLYTSSHLREKLQSSEETELPADQDAGVLSEDAMRLVELMRKYDIDREKQQAFIKRIKRRDISKNINEAIRKDDFGYMSHALGRVNREETITDYDRLKKLKNTFRKIGRSFLFIGEASTGKTNFAFLIAEVLKDMEGFEILTNLTSAEVGDTFQGFEEMERKTAEGGKKVVIVEDASNHFSGYGKERNPVQDYLRIYQNELAKNDAVLILLGHNGRGVHSYIRQNCFLVDKETQTSAKIYEEVNNGSGDELMFSLKNLPKHPMKYDPKEKTVFTWPEEDEGLTREEKLNKAKEEIGNKLADNRVVKTVDLPEYDNSLVADALRDVAQQHDYLKFVENKSPYRVKKKR